MNSSELKHDEAFYRSRIGKLLHSKENIGTLAMIVSVKTPNRRHPAGAMGKWNYDYYVIATGERSSCPCPWLHESYIIWL